ncbi:L-fuculokinase [Atlantibacter sp.]|uniref:L-fuculokinase n=1 Tax=Atlantibacter sp. TaxID=1903473 RepID=UPI0028AF190D|nr:L-fuculokinase [Atlantibacter sp.]
MMQDAVLVLDCGATNVRAIAIDKRGQILARGVVANASEPAAEDPAWHNWSLDHILQRFQQCCQQIAPQLDRLNLRAMTVTTFGVDGALTDDKGALLYPIISWKCPRTVPIMHDIARMIDPQTLQQISGIGQFSFNTLYKLLWLKLNQPLALENAHAWLFISSLINQRLTGEFTTDRTMAGTSQLMDLHTGAFSDVILPRAGIPARLFPRQVAPGDIVGELRPQMANFLGIRPGIPVISAGHDTQFALFGSGAGLGEPVLSSGTWEILMVRSAQINTALLPQYPGSTCELDSHPAWFNPGLQWLASGVLEWVRKSWWPQAEGAAVYQQMMAEAAALPPGAQGVTMQGNLLEGSDSGWRGVTLNTTRGHFYRAALENLTWQLKNNLQVLETLGGFRARELLLVGGGSRNMLWNQMKADILDLPIKILSEAETTVVGAALYAWAGCGEFASADAARASLEWRYRTLWPGEQRELWKTLRSKPC